MTSPKNWDQSPKLVLRMKRMWRNDRIIINETASELIRSKKKQNCSDQFPFYAYGKGLTLHLSKNCPKYAINELEKVEWAGIWREKIPPVSREEPEELDELWSPPWPRDARRKWRLLLFTIGRRWDDGEYREGEKGVEPYKRNRNWRCNTVVFRALLSELGRRIMGFRPCWKQWI